jgi:hypothetical protein
MMWHGRPAHGQQLPSGDGNIYFLFLFVRALIFDAASEITLGKFQQSLNALATRRPYRSFVVELHGGRRFEVDFPTALSFRDGVAVSSAPGGVPIIFDHESVIALLAHGGICGVIPENLDRGYGEIHPVRINSRICSAQPALTQL